MASVLVVLPIAYLALHSIPAADDFSNANVVSNLLKDNGNSYFLASLAGSAGIYETTGGYYTAIFFNYFCSPFLRAGLLGIRIFNCFGNLFFFASLFFMVRSVVKVMVADSRGLTWGVFFALLFCLTNNYMNQEIYGWYVVVVAYIIPISFCLLMVAFYVLALNSGKKRYVVLAALFGFLASGSSLNVAALNCGLSLLLLYVGVRKFDATKISLCITAFILLGGIINAVSPGNFVRRGFESPDYNVVGAAVVSVRLVVSRMVYLLSFTPFPVIAICVSLAFFSKLDPNGKLTCTLPQLLVATVLFFVGVVVVNFPVSLGYPNGAFPDRVVFVQDLAIYLLSFIWFGLLSIWAKSLFPTAKPSKSMLLSIGVACVLFCCNLLAFRGLDEWTTPYIIGTAANGSISEFADYEMGMLDEIRDSPDKDVVIDRPEASYKLLYPENLSNDKDNWINVAVAKYYGKDSVVLEPSS